MTFPKKRGKKNIVKRKTILQITKNDSKLAPKQMKSNQLIRKMCI